MENANVRGGDRVSREDAPTGHLIARNSPEAVNFRIAEIVFAGYSGECTNYAHCQFRETCEVGIRMGKREYAESLERPTTLDLSKPYIDLAKVRGHPDFESTLGFGRMDMDRIVGGRH